MISLLVKRRTAVAALAALLWAAVILVGGFEIIVANQAQSELRQEASGVLRNLDKIYGEIDAAFADIGATTPDVCSADKVLRMKRAMFPHPHIQDILYFDNDDNVPSCSAMLGIIADAKSLPAPEPLKYTTDGAEVWFDLPIELFDGHVASYMVREGHYAIVANMQEIRQLDIANPWETFVPDQDGSFSTHVDGAIGLHQEYLDKKNSPLFAPFLYSERSRNVTGSITLKMPIATAMARNIGPLIGALLIALATAAMVYFLILRALANRGAPMGRIKAALTKRRGFSCVYQPIVSLPAGEPIGCEVLSRFADELGPLGPDEFIPVIVKLRKTWEFTEMMMANSLRELKPVLEHSPDLKISVNFFPRDLRNHFLERISNSEAILYAIDNHIAINCEILETGFGHASEIIKTLSFLRALNFTISIDDFGTGSSNLHELRDVNAHYIKIDKSFVQGLARENASVRSSLIPHIVEMAKEVGAEIIAEGAETSAQVQLLCSLKIKYAQGYFFSRPVPMQKLLDFIVAGESFEGLDAGEDTAAATGATAAA
jgi:sensor c-di-GMP phosphodiesterase-like protein